jgi:mono/diheme cytochrome c family protein
MMFKGAVLGLPLLFAGIVLAGQSAQELQARGKELAEKECSTCHGLDLAASFTNTKAEWEGVVQSMIDKGANLKKEDISPVAEYLAAAYGPKQAKEPEKKDNTAAIKQLAEEACGGCHDFSPVAEQRLSKPDWDNLVRSMVDRGAAIEKDQIEAVVDYLAKTYPNK